jgi:hypothetical protein
MCNACGYPSIVGHWSDTGAATAGDRLRLRFERLAAINRLVAPYGLRAGDYGTTPGLQLFAAGGEWVLVEDIGALWTQAARLASCAIDPLSDRALGDD